LASISLSSFRASFLSSSQDILLTDIHSVVNVPGKNLKEEEEEEEEEKKKPKKKEQRK